VRIWDITIPMRPGLAGWPGDVPFRLDWTLRQRDGASVNVGAVHLSIHTGTHVDAPFHFDSHGPAIDAVPLEPYLGPCQVIDVSGSESIALEAVRDQLQPAIRRVLLRTGGWTDHCVFPATIPVMESHLVQWLGERATLLVGLDLPSVDQIDSKALSVHHALKAHHIAILESANLTEVEPGIYNLIALPMSIVGGDGAPVRAVLARP
jgi:arylformamidase